VALFKINKKISLSTIQIQRRLIALKSLMRINNSQIILKIRKWTQTNTARVMKKILNSIMIKMKKWKTFRISKTFKKVTRTIQNQTSAQQNLNSTKHKGKLKIR
jgi:hypothetical protein